MIKKDKTLVFKVIFRFVVCANLLLMAMPVSSASILGPAAPYNLFTLNSINVQTSESLGRVAAGGNITMSNYGVGSGTSSPATNSLIAGGDVNLAHLAIYNGGAFVGGNAYLDHYNVGGDVVVNGTLTLGPGGGTISGSASGNAGATAPINFVSAFTDLTATSTSLAGMTPTGVTHVEPWLAISLVGSGAFNVFNVNGSDLSQASSLAFNIDPGSVAVVNISGQNNGLSNFAISGTEGNRENILYNYYESLALGISGIGVKGSILAPNADVIFNNGHIDGTIVANSLSGTGEFHSFPFQGVTPVPLPAAVWLFGSGLLGVSLMGARRRRRN